jgi:ATP-dependent RNA helicase DHX37/DHR1
MLGDAYILLKSVAGSDWAEPGKLELFCASNGIRTKALTEVRKLRTQLTNEANLLLPGLELPVNPKLRPPSDHQVRDPLDDLPS